MCFDFPCPWDILPSGSLTHLGNSFSFFLKKKSALARDGGVGRADKKNLGQTLFFFFITFEHFWRPTRGRRRGEGRKQKDGRKEA